MKTATLIIAALDTIAWPGGGGNFPFAIGRGYQRPRCDCRCTGHSAVRALTGLRALLLAWRGAMPRLALALALAFPAVFAILFIGVVIAFA